MKKLSFATFYFGKPDFKTQISLFLKKKQNFIFEFLTKNTKTLNFQKFKRINFENFLFFKNYNFRVIYL